MTTLARWLLGLSDAFAQVRSVDDVIAELAERSSERTGARGVAALRREGAAYRCLSVRNIEVLERGGNTSDAEVARLLGEGTVERFRHVRSVVHRGVASLTIDVQLPSQRFGAVLLVCDRALASEALEELAAAARVAALACGGIVIAPSSPPAGGDRTAEHWEAIGRLTGTVLHELGNPVAFAALAASQLAQLARTPGDAASAEQARTLADDLALSVRQMAELLSELRRVSRGPEGARFVEPRAIVEGAVRLANAELRGVASITVEVGELPLVPGSVGSLGAGLAHLLSTVLRGQGGSLEIRGQVDGDDVLLTVEGFDFRMPRATEAVRIVRGLAASAEGRTELSSSGALSIRLPTVVETAAPSSRRTGERPRLLVIDDEAALARALASALGAAFEVVIATSAAEALQRIEERTFDVVLCDVHLEGESGIAVYEKMIERVPALAQRFALTSGGADADTEVIAKQRGLPILAKPFDWTELERELGRLSAGA